METAYAHALMGLIEKGMKPSEAVHSIQKKLAQTGRSSLFPKIGRAFERIAQRSAQKNGVVLVTARAHDHAHAVREASAILADLNVSAKDVVSAVDDSLIGGWRLEGKERLVDASFKKQLLSLYNRTTQS